MRKFEGYGGSAEVLVGVRAAWLVGIDYCNGFGDAKGLVGKMVIGDDQVQTKGPGFSGGCEGAYAGIDADDKMDSGGCGIGEDAGLHAVAFADAMGNVVGDLGRI